MEEKQMTGRLRTCCSSCGSTNIRKTKSSHVYHCRLCKQSFSTPSVKLVQSNKIKYYQKIDYHKNQNGSWVWIIENRKRENLPIYSSNTWDVLAFSELIYISGTRPDKTIDVKGELRKALKIPEGYRPYDSAVLGYKKDAVVNVPERKPNLITNIR